MLLMLLASPSFSFFFFFFPRVICISFVLFMYFPWRVRKRRLVLWGMWNNPYIWRTGKPFDQCTKTYFGGRSTASWLDWFLMFKFAGDSNFHWQEQNICFCIYSISLKISLFLLLLENLNKFWMLLVIKDQEREEKHTFFSLFICS